MFKFPINFYFQKLAYLLISNEQETFMKMHLLTFAVVASLVGNALAQPTDTISKAKSSGTITMGVRDSSGALSYTLGDGKYAGFHVEVCHRIIENLDKVVGKKLDVKYLSVTSQDRKSTRLNSSHSSVSRMPSSA